jgi:ferredoxin--NADP+ reductase
VAIVGSGPAACYAAEDVLSRRGLDAEVTMFERLPVPGGLVRFGVAPDHQATKLVAETFARTMRRDRFTLHLNVEVGRDIRHDEILAGYHAVVYATGASHDQGLDIPGVDLPGSHSAAEFVGWYNGDPDYADRRFDLSCERAVIVGNGNVALDVARVLLLDPQALARTDIAGHAYEELARSRIREVVVMGRRGPAQAAFTLGELMGLASTDGFDVRAEPEDPAAWAGLGGAVAEGDPTAVRKLALLASLRDRAPSDRRQAVLRFLTSPVLVRGRDSVESVEAVTNELVRDDRGQVVVRPTGRLHEIECGLVIRAVGHRGSPIAGLPYDERRGLLPQSSGRVTDPESGEAVRGVYTTGWIKRGPSGVIGTNRGCARETVDAVVADYLAGQLDAPGADGSDTLLAGHRDRIDLDGWARIDAFERHAGGRAGRPRVKIVDRGEMVAIANAKEPIDA